MIIKEIGSVFSVTVLCIYWSENVRHYLAPLFKESYGLNGIIDSKCVVIDYSIDDMVIVKNSDGNDLIINKLVYDNGLLDDMIDHDPEAMAKFWALCKEHDVQIFFDD